MGSEHLGRPDLAAEALKAQLRWISHDNPDDRRQTGRNEGNPKHLGGCTLCCDLPVPGSGIFQTARCIPVLVCSDLQVNALDGPHQLVTTAAQNLRVSATEHGLILPFEP